MKSRKTPGDENSSEIDDDDKNVVIYQAVFNGEKTIIEVTPETLALHEHYYFGTMFESTNQTIDLEPEEVLLLMERNRLELYNLNQQPLTSQEFLKQIVKLAPRIWIRYIVYRDLRQRGYIVRLGYGDGIDFRVYPRGAKKDQASAKYFIVILAEGEPIHLETIDKITRQKIHARKQLILAIVDRLEDTTYYELDELTLNENHQIPLAWTTHMQQTKTK